MSTRVQYLFRVAISSAKPGNVTGLYEAIKKLLDAPELRRNFGEAGRALINRNYSSVSMAQNYLRVYLEALSSRAVAEQN